MSQQRVRTEDAWDVRLTWFCVWGVCSFGLTRDAELLNGRLAMLGLVVLGVYTGVTGGDFLQVIDQGLGGLLLKA